MRGEQKKCTKYKLDHDSRYKFGPHCSFFYLFISIPPPLSISFPISISPAISFFIAILSPSVWQQTEIIQKGEAQ
jgi:hypothetical protein